MSTIGQDDLTGLLGIGVPGEVRAAPDGELYEWTQTVDGLGNPARFWRRLRRRLGRLVGRVAPLARQAAGFVPGAYRWPAKRLLDPVAPSTYRGKLPGLGELYESPDGSLYEVQEAQAEDPIQGLGQDELQQVMGLGQVGEVRRGPDGELYQWIEGVDGLGNPVGFWGPLKRLARKFRPFLRKVVPFAAKVASFIPGYGTAVAAGLRTARPFLRKAGLAGELGELYASADGTVYELQGISDDPELTGASREAGIADAPTGPDETLTGQTAEERVEGLDEGFVQEDVASPLGLYVRDPGSQTPWHTPPTEPPVWFRPLW